MPELPEVEVVRRGLAPIMEGTSFASVTLNRGDLRFPFDEGFAQRLKGERIKTLSRRAKYLIAEMESGLALAIHLGMTGRFTILHNGHADTPGAHYYNHDAMPRHDHVVFVMSSGDTIRYNDVRRFGYMTLFRAAAMAEHPMFKGLGVEPLSEALSPDYLVKKAKGKTQALKGFLLDQRIIAGLGNIYVCEALFRAGLPPEAEAGVLASGKKGKAAAERLCAAVQERFGRRIARGGIVIPRLSPCRRRFGELSGKV